MRELARLRPDARRRVLHRRGAPQGSVVGRFATAACARFPHAAEPRRARSAPGRARGQARVAASMPPAGRPPTRRRKGEREHSQSEREQRARQRGLQNRRHAPVLPSGQVAERRDHWGRDPTGCRDRTPLAPSLPIPKCSLRKAGPMPRASVRPSPRDESAGTPDEATGPIAPVRRGGREPASKGASPADPSAAAATVRGRPMPARSRRRRAPRCARA